MKIGIPTSISKTQYYINKAYAQYVIEAGFEPIFIVPGNNVKSMLDIIDGLILPGGIDIDPIFYGMDNYTSYSVDPEKDEFERDLFHKARNIGKPIFGICRGFQLIARELLLKDGKMENFLVFCDHIAHHNQVDNQAISRSNYQHFVDFNPDGLYGKGSSDLVIDSMPVNSMHHQCLVANFGSHGRTIQGDFQMTAWTRRAIKTNKKVENQEVVCEAFSIKGWGAPILAVQWHPEELMDVMLIQNFFDNKHANKKILYEVA